MSKKHLFIFSENASFRVVLYYIIEKILVSCNDLALTAQLWHFVAFCLKIKRFLNAF